MASQPYGFDTSQQSGAYPSLSSQGTPAQCTCGFYNGHHTTSCPQYYSAQGNNGSSTAFGYSTVDTQPYVGYTQQTNMSTYNTHNIGVPGYLCKPHLYLVPCTIVTLLTVYLLYSTQLWLDDVQLHHSCASVSATAINPSET